MRLFLDTNVIIDFLEIDRENYQSAAQLINYAVKNRHRIITSEDILTTVFYLSKNKHQTLLFFRSIQDKWHIATFGKNTLKTAVQLALEKNLDLEDVLQCLCAKDNHCDTLVTNDNFFYDCGVKIQTPQQFLAQSQ